MLADLPKIHIIEAHAVVINFIVFVCERAMCGDVCGGRSNRSNCLLWLKWSHNSYALPTFYENDMIYIFYFIRSFVCTTYILCFYIYNMLCYVIYIRLIASYYGKYCVGSADENIAI